ncbi:hypothetical protein B0T25DRAFT_597297 [Lasiosphaeria hispida]|uniref:Uncharacterized protein n=1 Tax=Lasiosphaeria hispida TaxID=260671 RepID=A0AAJ0MKH5_9PEZI|nr:hypothetical protein B0T25DRAFT_597297 [Lasiosphaeria hispida]
MEPDSCIDLTILDGPGDTARPSHTLNAAFTRRPAFRSMPKQILDVINIPEADLAPDLLDRPNITSCNGRAFILEKWERHKRSRNSWINAHGYWLMQVVNNSLGPSWWYCSHYFETLYSRKATAKLTITMFVARAAIMMED